MLVQGTFYGESRIFTFPFIDLNGLPPAVLQNQAGGNPLQMSADRDADWLHWGYSAQYCVPAAGGIASGSPLNLQVQRQDTRELQAAQVSRTADFGTPLEHLAGKAGSPFYYSYPKRYPSGTRLLASVAQFTGATPTGRSPLYLSAHAQLVKPGAAPTMIGSKYSQQMIYRGEWVPYTAFFDFATTPLGINQSVNLTLPINTTQYFFIDTLIARYGNTPGAMGPNDALSPLIAEDEITVSVKDTSNQSPFTLPNPAPLWSMFGSLGSRLYAPPSCYVVRPRGSIDITIQNGPTAQITKPLWLTLGGCLVDNISKQILENLNA